MRSQANECPHGSWAGRSGGFDDRWAVFRRQSRELPCCCFVWVVCFLSWVNCHTLPQGFIIGHVTPEAQEGGPIALVRNGDQITIDSSKKAIHLHVSEQVRPLFCVLLHFALFSSFFSLFLRNWREGNKSGRGHPTSTSRTSSPRPTVVLRTNEKNNQQKTNYSILMINSVKKQKILGFRATIQLQCAVPS